MAEIVSIKTQKPAVESITVKLTKPEALDLARAYRGTYPWMSGTLPRKLEDAANGKTSVLTADAILANF